MPAIHHMPATSSLFTLLIPPIPYYNYLKAQSVSKCIPGSIESFITCAFPLKGAHLIRLLMTNGTFTLTASKFTLTTGKEITFWPSWAFVAKVALCVCAFLICTNISRSIYNIRNHLLSLAKRQGALKAPCLIISNSSGGRS